MKKEPELIADKGRIRSKEDEEALDKKIAEIRRRNQLIEQRKELVEEDRINEYGKMSLENEAKGTIRVLKPKSGEWDRDWDAGKISVENWKENVPDIDDNKGSNVHYLRGFKNRKSDKNNIYGSSIKNKAKTKKIVGITKKQKLKDSKVIVCIETNKNASLAKKKIFSGKNTKKLKNCDNGNGDNGNVSCNMKQMSRLKQSHDGQSNSQSTRNYKKPSPRKRYSTRRISSTASVALLSTTVAQHLDIVKVNISMLELKKDAQTIAKSNNNIGKVDNNLQKLAAVVAETAEISAAPVLPIVEEYGK